MLVKLGESFEAGVYKTTTGDALVKGPYAQFDIPFGVPCRFRNEWLVSEFLKGWYTISEYHDQPGVFLVSRHSECYRAESLITAVEYAEYKLATMPLNQALGFVAGMMLIERYKLKSLDWQAIQWAIIRQYEWFSVDDDELLFTKTRFENSQRLDDEAETVLAGLPDNVRAMAYRKVGVELPKGNQ